MGYMIVLRRRVESDLARYRRTLAAAAERPSSIVRPQADAATDRHVREDAEGHIAQLEARLAAVVEAEGDLARHAARSPKSGTPEPGGGAVDRLPSPRGEHPTLTPALPVGGDRGAAPARRRPASVRRYPRCSARKRVPTRARVRRRRAP